MAIGFPLRLRTWKQLSQIGKRYALGENFSFTDNTEEMFDIASRTFHSFIQAGNEAAISRLYGGIHFRDAIENGQREGAALGKKISEKLNAAGIEPLSRIILAQRMRSLVNKRGSKTTSPVLVNLY